MPLDWTDFLASGQKQPRGNAGNARLAQMLMEQGVDSSPIQSPFQGLARLAQAYVGGGMMQDEQAKQQQGNQAMADILAPPSYSGGNGPQQTAPLTPPLPPVPPPAAPPGGGLPDQTARVSGDVPPSLQFAQPQVNQQADPRNAQIAQLLNGGIGQDVFAKQAMDQLGFGTPKDLLKGAPGDVFFDPKTHQAIPGMSVPNKPDKPEATPDIIQIAREMFPNDPAKQHEYMMNNSPSKLRAITNNYTGNQDAGWQMATDPGNKNLPYRINVRTGQTVGLDGKPYIPQGYGKPTTNNPRSAVSIYMEKWRAENPNANSDQTLSAMNRFAGEQAEQRTLGNSGAKVESANAGLDTVIDQSKAVYSKLPRGQFVPFNQLAKMALTGAFSSPEQADAYAADAGVINLWGKSINPNGVLTVEAQRRGEELLSQAQSPEAHAAVLERMRAEGAASKGGIDKFRTPGTTNAAPQQHGGKTVVRTGTDKTTGKKVIQYGDGSVSYAP